MRRIMRYLLNIFMFTLALSSNAWAVSQIEILSNGGSAQFQGYRFSPPYGNMTEAFVDLGESLSSKIVRITAKAGTQFRVNVQMESSLTIMNEGPHLDLVDWKHCTTEWREAERITDSEFRIPVTEEIDQACFQEISVAEIRDEVLKRGGTRWADLIKDDASITDYPMALALSSVTVKVEELLEDGWTVVTIIRFSIPMGC